MQILVVVANIQMRTLKTDLGKGSMKIAISHGLIGPKPKAAAESNDKYLSAGERECG